MDRLNYLSKPPFSHFRDPDIDTRYPSDTLERQFFLWVRLEHTAKMSAATLVALREMFEHIAEMMPEALRTRDGWPVVEYINSLDKPAMFDEILDWLREYDICRPNVRMDMIEYTCRYRDTLAIDFPPADAPTTKEGFLQQCASYRFLCELEFCAIGRLALKERYQASIDAVSKEGSMARLNTDVLGVIHSHMNHNALPDWFRPTRPRGRRRQNGTTIRG